MVADFSGYATKAGLKCSDGRTIMPHAFKEQDGISVPLVWQHGHTEPTNVLGHAILENREDGVYCYGYFNDTEAGKNAKKLVEHKDIKALSIYANQLVERSKQVIHGAIREVSLVLSGANPGALIDYVTIAHSDGSFEPMDDEAIIYTGLTLEHEDKPEPDPVVEEAVVEEAVVEETVVEEAVVEETEESVVEHALSADATLQDVYDSMDEDQKSLLHFMIGAVLDDKAGTAAQHSEIDDNDDNSTSNTDSDEGNLEHKEGSEMARNVFEDDKTASPEKYSLSHDDMAGIVAAAKKNGSLKDAVEDFALAHGINDIDLLFPDAQLLNNTPEFDKRRTEWVAGVMSGTRHSPFSRIKTVTADLTYEDARAKGYVKGNLKREEFFGLASRTTTPTTIYKKQKLDRDDIVDITGFDVVAWLKAEMRMMLEEELARAILIGDGRDVAHADKINEQNIRPIAKEHELFATTLWVNIGDTNSTPQGNSGEIVDAVLAGRKFFKGSGTPTFYTSETVITSFLLQRDTLGRRIYRNLDEVASDLRVAAVVPVEVMEDEADLIGIIVNLQDYTIGADSGGEVNMFDDFDIDYNQQKYLIETRVSGALTKIKSALVIRKTANSAAVLVVPTEPGFDPATGVITIPTVTGVVYKNGAGVTLDAGAQTALASGASLLVQAVPASDSYFFANDNDDEWTFTRD